MSMVSLKSGSEASTGTDSGTDRLRSVRGSAVPERSPNGGKVSIGTDSEGGLSMDLIAIRCGWKREHWWRNVIMSGGT
jgi:hypothetical protein